MARLIVLRGPDEGRQFDLTEAVTSVGRDKGNTIVLHDHEVSRRHAEFRLAKGIWSLYDLHSANGSLLNSRPTQDAPLTPGDRIFLGQTLLMFDTARTERTAVVPLADRVELVTRKEPRLGSAIVRTIAENAGSQIMSQPDTVGAQWLKDRLASLTIVYETIQAVSAIMDLDLLLEKIMELLFRSIDADHGCVMIRNQDSGQYEPRAVRFRAADERPEKMIVSRTIMDYVLREKQGVLLADASQDERFASESITRFRLQEVICVPMKGRHETLGVVFLNTQSTSQQLFATGGVGRFREDQLALAIAIAHQAALAVEDTWYHQALVNAERLAAVGQTIAALSHHIKNIMQGIVFGSDLVRSGLDKSDEGVLRKGWRMVERNQGKIHDLVLDMLSYSKEREPAVEMTSLAPIIADVLEIVKGRIDELKVRLEVRTPPDMPMVPADPEGIHRALLNIISNALDALYDRPDPYLGIQTLIEADNEWAKIVIVDRGYGIAADKLGDIFRPFVSTKGAKGTGLGLAVSRKILREHGGDILVQSQEGRGSKFSLRLPLKSPLLNDSAASGTREFPSMPEDE